MNDVKLTGLRVLVVEDEPIVAMLIEDTLGELGCIVADIAARFEDAMRMAASLDFDVAVLDVNLGGQQTYPVAERLSERKIPFAFATGYGASGLSPEFRHVPILAKPFQLSDLAGVLQKLLLRSS
ncbi:MAG: response regulator [Beijerinckiaceae bacterium]|nr:response regulator [Beijerinckiaceae bacterium]